MQRAARDIVGLGVMSASLAIAGGCSSIPEGRYAVDDVTVVGAQKIDASDVKDEIATSPSPKFMGLFQGTVYEYEIFDRAVLQRDLARIERYYRAKGYYGAHARAGRFMTTKENHVRVEIVVEEGLPVVDGELAIAGLEGLPADLAAAAQKAAKEKLPPGEPFDEDRFKAAEKAIERVLTDRGYAFAKVTRDARLDIVHHVANATFQVRPDKLATFGKVTIEGPPAGAGKAAEPIPTGPVRRAVDIEEGAPYSTLAIDSATESVLDLGVFSSVEIVPDLPDPPPEPRVVPITVKVEPTRMREVRAGGGLEFDQIKTDVHLLAGWEDHDFLGGLRDFRVDFQPGAVLYPLRINNFVAPNQILLEERLRWRLNQPGFIESRINGFLGGEANVFPLLVKTNPSPDDPVVGYFELKGVAGIDRTLWKLFGRLSYNLQIEQPFSYKGGLDPALDLLIIAYPDLVAQLDLRDDRIHPHKGLLLSNDLQVAGGIFGGAAQDVRVQPEVRTYLPLAKKVTFATRASVGFLFPTNYGDVVENHLGDPVTDQNRADRVRDIETVFFRGFFSGGSSSNRGFPVRGVAPHGVVPFLNPNTASQQVALSCDPSPANGFNPDPSQCSIPIGGLTLWELSNELRLAVAGPFWAALFCDMSDVSPRRGNLRFDHLHLSCGAGARYETPVGPIRFDIGYRIQPLQVLGFANEDDLARADPTAGVQPKVLGVPLAIAFGIGEAY